MYNSKTCKGLQKKKVTIKLPKISAKLISVKSKQNNTKGGN